MDILAVQQRLIDNGYQFIEHIFNDGSKRNCFVMITKDTYVDFSCENHFLYGELGWGRFERHQVWMYVAEWLDEQEFGE